MAAIELITALQQALGQIERASRETQDMLDDEQLSLKDQVEIGQSLWEIIRHVQDALEPVKDSLRDEALHRQNGAPGRQVMSGRSRDSRCTIVVQPPTMKVRPDSDVAALMAALGSDFPAFFTLTATPRREFADRAAERPDLLPTLVKAVDTVTEKPRVSFKD